MVKKRGTILNPWERYTTFKIKMRKIMNKYIELIGRNIKSEFISENIVELIKNKLFSIFEKEKEIINGMYDDISFSYEIKFLFNNQYSYILDLRDLTLNDELSTTIKIYLNQEIEPNYVENSYKLKLKIKEILFLFYEEIYCTYDFLNSQLCSPIYIKIHKIENKVREIINLEMISKFGINWFHQYSTDDYIKEVEDYSHFYKKNYREFKVVKTELTHISPSILLDLLKK